MTKEIEFLETIITMVWNDISKQELIEIIEERKEAIEDQLSIHIVSNCNHENEQMHQGDGFVYVTCKDCGTDL